MKDGKQGAPLLKEDVDQLVRGYARNDLREIRAFSRSAKFAAAEEGIRFDIGTRLAAFLNSALDGVWQ